MKRIGIIIFSVFIAVCTDVSGKQKAPEEKPVRHYIDIYGAGGVSHWNYPLTGGEVTIGGAFSAGAGYTFFFLPGIGVQAGLSFSRIASSARLTQPMEWREWQDGSALTDYMGETYIHRTELDHWQENQQAYLLEIPVGLRFRYFKNRESRIGLHAAAGLKVAFPVIAGYTRVSGDITHTGWYEQWQLLLHDLPGRFETERFREPQEESMADRLHIINAEAYAELGTTIRINPHLELYVAAFGQMMINDFCAIQQNEKTALGFRNETNRYAFMNEYRGLIGTDKTGSSHPWMAGVKAGLSIWPGKTDKEKKRELKELQKQFPEMAAKKVVHDTIYLHDTIVIRNTGLIHDTICSSPQKRLDSLLSEAVIWFHLDEYIPILEPAYILDSIAAMMHRHPSLRIHVNGHACRLGTERYNQRLALLRAQAVAALLEEKGISGDRMFVWSYGANKPYRYNSEKQLSKDRRVEIIPDLRKK